MTASSATPINRSPTSPTTIPTPNRSIAAAVPDPSPLSDLDVCWSSLTFSRNLALGNAAICSRATGPVDASGDEDDLLCTAVRLAYVKPIIPGLRTANRNSVIRAADDVWSSLGGGDDVRLSIGSDDDVRLSIVDDDDVWLSVSGGDGTDNKFSVDSNGDTVVWFSKDGDDNRDVRFSTGADVDQDLRFSVSGGDDQDVRFSIGRDVDLDVRFSVEVDDDQDVGFSVGGSDDDRLVVRFSLGGDKDVIPMSVIGRAEATAGRVSHKCVTLTVTVAAVVIVDIISIHDVAQ